MTDRGMKKWKPFNSVVSAKELLKKEEKTKVPSPSKDEIVEFEELLKKSLYSGIPITITYFDKNKVMVLEDTVISIDTVKQDIHFKTITINFRQIYNVK